MRSLAFQISRRSYPTCRPPLVALLVLAGSLVFAHACGKSDGADGYDVDGYAELHTHMLAQESWNKEFVWGELGDGSAAGDAVRAKHRGMPPCTGGAGLDNHGYIRKGLGTAGLELVSTMLTNKTETFSFSAALPKTSQDFTGGSMGDTGPHLKKRHGFAERPCRHVCRRANSTGPAATNPPVCPRSIRQPTRCRRQSPGVCEPDNPTGGVSTTVGTATCGVETSANSCRSTGYCEKSGDVGRPALSPVPPCHQVGYPNCDQGDRCVSVDATSSMQCSDLDRKSRCQHYGDYCQWESCRPSPAPNVLTCADLDQSECGSQGICLWQQCAPDRDPTTFVVCEKLDENACSQHADCTWNFPGFCKSVNGGLQCNELTNTQCRQEPACRRGGCRRRGDAGLQSPSCSNFDASTCGNYAKCQQGGCSSYLGSKPLSCSTLTNSDCRNHRNDGGCDIRNCEPVDCKWERVAQCRLRDRHAAKCGRDWPAWDTPTHQQHWWGYLKDAHEQGLKVVSASVLSVHPMAELMTGYDRTPYQVIVDQLDLANRFAGNHDWVEIAKTPDEAKRIIDDGKLALVLTLEAEFPFCQSRPCGTRSVDWNNVDKILTEYRNKGLSSMQIVGHFDNRFGGVAIYKKAVHSMGWIYKELVKDGRITRADFRRDSGGTIADAVQRANRYLRQRDVPRALRIDQQRFFNQFFPIERFDEVNDFHAILAKVGPVSGPNCVERNSGSGGRSIACNEALSTGGLFSDEPRNDEAVNKLGLTSDGKQLVRKLLKKGILVDVAHLSERGVEQARSVVQTYNSNRNCTAPLYISHGHPRDLLAKYREKATPPEFLKSIRELGGMFGVRTGTDPLEHYPASGVADNCKGSTREFAQALAYFDDMNVDVGFAFDFNGMIHNAAPRYGLEGDSTYAKRTRDHACLGDISQQHAQKQANKVSDDPSTGYTDESHLNTQGFGHVGLMGAFVQDLENIGAKKNDLDHLRNSAEKFLEMWKRARIAKP